MGERLPYTQLVGGSNPSLVIFWFSMFNIKDNLKAIFDSIAEEEIKSNRKPGSVVLCAVSKTKPYEMISEVVSGQTRVFNIGENYVQEIEKKFKDIKRDYTLRMIGHLQCNKVNKVVPLVDTIDSVDSLKLLDKINECSIKNGKVTRILIELNTAFDGEKTGFMSEDEALEAIEDIEQKKGDCLSGFMTMGELGGSEVQLRRSFAKLREFAEKVKREHPDLNPDVLSMGMSSDWRYAVMEGSTMVRIGSAIFGARTQ